jgi:hypothetical protein
MASRDSRIMALAERLSCQHGGTVWSHYDTASRIIAEEERNRRACAMHHYQGEEDE